MPVSVSPCLISTVAEVTPVWMAKVLTATATPVQVSSVKTSPVGTGQLASSYRLQVNYGEETSPDLPETFVLKIASADEGSRHVAKVSGVYVTEVNFYLNIASWVNVPVPLCYHAVISDSGDQFGLLLEDLAPATQGNQLEGLNLKQMEQAVVAIANLHAATWNGKRVDHMKLLHIDDALIEQYAKGTGALAPAFIERYAAKLTQDSIDIVKSYSAAAWQWWQATHHNKNRACVHGDYRADNLMFAESSTGSAMNVVDWQTTTLSSPGHDLGHLLGTSIKPALRRDNESNLLVLYLETLRQGGVSDYSGEDCLADYRMGLFYPLFVSIFAGMQVEQTERGDDMFAVMCNNACSAILDNDCLSILKAL